MLSPPLCHQKPVLFFFFSPKSLLVFMIGLVINISFPEFFFTLDFRSHKLQYLKKKS